ncbi:MAG: hypothetical protein QGH51_00245 [Planctomycetota bacterium]|jgi:hypothetical protein|nr:hypothetical protein [Planctomycetota bacterium]MDP6940436.1 hypothetical protein [Planctomycetota bacterium]
MSTAFFVLNLLLVVACLFATIHAGRQKVRAAHYRWAGAMIVLLAGAIVQAEMIGRDWVFEEIPKQVHLVIASSALIAFPLVAWSGIRLATGGNRGTHQRFVFLFIALVVGAILTALWMFHGATRIIAE